MGIQTLGEMIAVDSKDRQAAAAAMSLRTWEETLTASVADGPTLTAAATATCLLAAQNITLDNDLFKVIGRRFRIILAGKISCAVTTPGTAQFQVRLGPTKNITVFDTGAIALNTVAKTDVPFHLEILLDLRQIGTGTNSKFYGFGRFTSEALVGAPLPSAGGNAVIMVPVGAPTLGTGFDNTAVNIFDVLFTQTVATGSITVMEAILQRLN